MTATTVYGIPNCDTVKKARAWLDEQGVAYTFHDFKKQGVSAALLDEWMQTVSWNQLLNRAGTTFKKLSDADKAAVVDAASARTVLLATPSAIKRPVVRWADGALTVGFDAAVFAQRR
jgi:Spx/MgsR family transcriptional regulator